MATKHQATSPRTGETFKRTSQNRVYSHAVIVHFKARLADANWRARDAYAKAEWRRDLRLAQAAASSWKGDHIEAVEIVPATIV